MDKMQAALKQYLTSKEMNERLCKDLQELVKNNVNVDMSSEKLIAVAVGLMNQYQEYAKANGITQTDVASILAFLSQGEIQQQIKEEAENLVKNRRDSEYYHKTDTGSSYAGRCSCLSGVCQE